MADSPPPQHPESAFEGDGQNGGPGLPERRGRAAQRLGRERGPGGQAGPSAPGKRKRQRTEGRVKADRKIKSKLWPSPKWQTGRKQRGEKSSGKDKEFNRGRTIAKFVCWVQVRT